MEVEALPDSGVLPTHGRIHTETKASQQIACHTQTNILNALLLKYTMSSPLVGMLD